MNYVQQSTAPAWFNSDASCIYESATSGSSPFNEYYEFTDRAEAITYINRHFRSQPFMDEFIGIDGEYYHEADSLYIEDLDQYVAKPDAQVAPLSSLIAAESRF